MYKESCINIISTRMHSSRMRTVRSSGHLLGGGSAPGGRGGSASGGSSQREGVCCGWGVCSQGVSAPGGVCSGGCVCSRGVHSQGVSAPGWCIPPCTEADTSPCGQTDACKNITFATSLRTVIITIPSSMA